MNKRGASFVPRFACCGLHGVIRECPFQQTLVCIAVNTRSRQPIVLRPKQCSARATELLPLIGSPRREHRSKSAPVRLSFAGRRSSAAASTKALALLLSDQPRKKALAGPPLLDRAIGSCPLVDVRFPPKATEPLLWSEMTRRLTKGR